MYIIDSDALIHAFRYDFPPQKDPGTFWNWLSQMNKDGGIVVPEKVLEEIERGEDNLYSFLVNDKKISKEPTSKALPYLSRVINSYGRLTETGIEDLDKKADPYLVAHALSLNGASVISNEIPKPNAAPHNKKVPDICKYNGVNCIRYPRFLWNMQGGKFAQDESPPISPS